MYQSPTGRRYFVFDCHTHIGEAQLFQSYDLPIRFGPDEMSALMNEHGIDAVCGFSPRVYGSDYDAANTFNIEEATRHEGRIVPFFRFTPNNPWDIEKNVTRYTRAGVTGIKLHPIADGPYVVNRHPLVLSLLEHATAAGVRVVLIHTGGHWCATPGLVADLAMHFKDLQFIIGHSGYRGLHYEAIAFAKRLDNLWLDTSGLDVPNCVKEMVESLGTERILYGSDAPFGSFRLEVEKIAVAARLSESEAQAVLGENMARLMGVSIPKPRSGP